METSECLEIKYCGGSGVCKFILTYCGFNGFSDRWYLLFKATLPTAEKAYMSMERDRTAAGQGQVSFPS